MKKIIILISVIGFLINSTFASGAVLFFDPVEKSVSQNEKVTLYIQIDPEGDFVNAVEGVIKFDKSIRVVGIDYNNSIINLWVEEPGVLDNKISFSGIIPGGFNGVLKPLDKKIYPGILFGITFEAVRTGSATVNIEDIKVLKNDGLGTEVESSIVPSIINVDNRGSDFSSYLVFVFIGIIIAIAMYSRIKNKGDEIS